MKAIINPPDPCGPCGPPCRSCCCRMTFSKYLPQCSVVYPVHLDLLAHPAESYVIFTPGGGSYSLPAFSFPDRWFMCLQTGGCASSAAGNPCRNMQGHPKAGDMSLILDIVCIIFLSLSRTRQLLRLRICCFWFGFTAVTFIMSYNGSCRHRGRVEVKVW